MRFEYELRGRGWATATVSFDEQHVEMAVSYFHDSLRDIASAVRALVEGAPEVRAIFMDEPGEHHVVFRRHAGDTIEVEVLWFDTWRSWGIGAARNSGERRLLATIRIAHIRGQVLSAFQRLLAEHGQDGYLRVWSQHPFPEAEMNALRQARTGRTPGVR